MPFDLAFSVDEATRAAFAILFSQFNGRRFDWQSFTFEEDK